MDQETQKESGLSLGIPAAILISGVIIAGAIIFIGMGSGKNPTPTKDTNPEQAEIRINSVSDKDHILGNPSADVIIIEFSDLECPFCKSFHQTMKRVMEEYGPNGDVAWVYRHFPLDSLHAKARKEAEAAECAGELGGQLGFWSYIDRIFETTPSNDGLDLEKLPQIAVEIGLERKTFEECLASGKHKELIDAHIEDAIASGGRGTPHTIILGKNGETIPVLGAESFEQVKSKIDSILN